MVFATITPRAREFIQLIENKITTAFSFTEQVPDVLTRSQLSHSYEHLSKNK